MTNTQPPRRAHCDNCGRDYPFYRFSSCPFCFAAEVFKAEAEADHCPTCGSYDKQTHCPKCGKEYNGSHYCLQCGHIKAKGGGY